MLHGPRLPHVCIDLRCLYEVEDVRYRYLCQPPIALIEGWALASQLRRRSCVIYLWVGLVCSLLLDDSLGLEKDV